LSPPSRRAKASTSAADRLDYQEKTYAAGRIPAAISSAKAVRPKGDAGLRLIDRPIRPLFVDGWRNETQVIVTVLVARHGERSRYRGAGGCVRALTIFRRPFKGPIGAARVGFANDEYVLNPTLR